MSGIIVNIGYLTVSFRCEMSFGRQEQIEIIFMCGAVNSLTENSPICIILSDLQVYYKIFIPKYLAATFKGSSNFQLLKTQYSILNILVVFLPYNPPQKNLL